MTDLRYSIATFSRGTFYKVGFLLLVDLDLVLTLLAVNLGFIEMNPFMLRLLSRPGELLLAKGVVPLLVAWLVPGRLLLPALFFMVLVTFWNVATIVLFL